MPANVRHNPERSRYEIFVDSRLAGVAEYRVAGDSMIFPHTEITPAMRGRGLAAELVRGALDDVRKSGRPVIPRCSYVARFVADHPEYADLVAA